MTDLEITKLCAEAIGIKAYQRNGMDGLFYKLSVAGIDVGLYDPLHNDAQAMALVMGSAPRLCHYTV